MAQRGPTSPSGEAALRRQRQNAMTARGIRRGNRQRGRENRQAAQRQYDDDLARAMAASVITARDEEERRNNGFKLTVYVQRNPDYPTQLEKYEMDDVDVSQPLIYIFQQRLGENVWRGMYMYMYNTNFDVKQGTAMESPYMSLHDYNIDHDGHTEILLTIMPGDKDLFDHVPLQESARLELRY